MPQQEEIYRAINFHKLGSPTVGVTFECTSTGLKMGKSTEYFAFYGATPCDKPSAYTQTYSTADKTHADDGSSNVATADLVDDGGAYNATWCDTVVTMCNEIKADFNNLRTTLTDLKGLANSIIDDLQELGLVG